jgi:hypothetical protein
VFDVLIGAFSHPHAHSARSAATCHDFGVHPLIRWFRANPQAFLLLLICVVLGLGTFIAVVIAIAGSGGPQISGDPSGLIAPLTALLG